MVAARGPKTSTPGSSLKSEVKVLPVCAFVGEVSWRCRSFESGDRAGISEAADDWALEAGAARGGQRLELEADGARRSVVCGANEGFDVCVGDGVEAVVACWGGGVGGPCRR